MHRLSKNIKLSCKIWNVSVQSLLANDGQGIMTCCKSDTANHNDVTAWICVFFSYFGFTSLGKTFTERANSWSSRGWTFALNIDIWGADHQRVTREKEDEARLRLCLKDADSSWFVALWLWQLSSIPTFRWPLVVQPLVEWTKVRKQSANMPKCSVI